MCCRYLNLDNLVLTEEGHAQLCDFSLSYLGDIDEQIVNKPMVTDLKLQFPAPEVRTSKWDESDMVQILAGLNIKLIVHV